MFSVRAQAEQSLKNYMPLAGAGDERRMADATTQGWQTYVALHEKFGALARSADAATLATLYRGEMRTEFNKFQAALKALIEFNIREANQSVQDGAALGGSAQLWILGFLVVAAALCVGGGWSMIRSISRPVAAMTQAMHRLAQWDMATEIPGVTRGDEIGAMAAAVRVFKDNMIDAAALAVKQETARSTRERRQAAMERHTQDFGSSFSGVMTSLASSAEQMRRASEAMAGAAKAVTAESARNRGGHQQILPKPDCRGGRGRRTHHHRCRDFAPGGCLGRGCAAGGAAGGSEPGHDAEPFGGDHADRRRCAPDQRDRQPDQSAGSECDD